MFILGLKTNKQLVGKLKTLAEFFASHASPFSQIQCSTFFTYMFIKGYECVSD